MRKIILCAISLALIFTGCSKDKAGNFELYMTDAPIQGLEHVYVTVSGIYVRKGDEWSQNILSNPPLTLDLLTLRDKEELISEIELEAGTYVALKVVVSAATVVYNGTTFALTIDPPAEVIIPVSFTIRGDALTELVLDFDAEQSVKDGGQGQFYLLPVIAVKRIGY